MQLKSDEIAGIIKRQIKNYSDKTVETETGHVIEVGDGIAKATGLENCMSNELIEFENGEMAMAMNLDEETVSLCILGSDKGIREGSTVKRTGRVVEVGVGEELIGRVVDALGKPIDGKGDINCTHTRPIVCLAPVIIE